MEESKIEKKEFKALAAWYGSLRIGHGNWRWVKDNINHIDTVVVDGFKMYSLFDSYPAIVASDKEEDRITVDLVEITDEDTYNSVVSMEMGAGYTERFVTHEGKDYQIWVFEDESKEYAEERLKPVEGGDWTKYKESLQ